MSESTSVYKYYDNMDLLIYVGITKRGISRNQEHNHSKEWWHLVERQDVEHFETRDAAHAREVALIESFSPPFNKQHNAQHVTMRSSYLALRASADFNDSPFEVARRLNKRLPLEVLGSPTWSDNSATVRYRSRITHVTVSRALTAVDNSITVRADGNKVGHVVDGVVHGPFFFVDVQLKERIVPGISAELALKFFADKGAVQRFEPGVLNLIDVG